MPTYPGSPKLTVDILLKQPRLISRALSSLTSKRFVTDRIFSRGSSAQIAGGAALYQKSESIYPDRNVEEVGLRGEWPRTGWTEEIFTAVVHKYGLEVPIADETKRRNALDQLMRAQIKLGNAVVKYVDTKAIALLRTEATRLTMVATADWTTAATDIVLDIARAQALIEDQDEGFVGDVLVVNPAQQLDLIIDKDIRDALLQAGSTVRSSLLTGQAMPIMGLRNIITTGQMPAGEALLVSSGVTGTIADEQPEADENYSLYSPAAGFSPVYVKTYRNDNVDETIIRAARFPAMWISEPKSYVHITGA